MEEQQENGKCSRPHQSEMEQAHERWVLATLNFLMGMDIPVHRKDERGNRIKGDLEIPERLGLVAKKVASAVADATNARHEANAIGRELRELKAKFDHLEHRIRCVAGQLKPSTSSDYAVKAAYELLSNYLETKNQPTDHPEPDHKGVKKYRFDVRDVMVKLGLDNLAHDIGPDERLCPSCWGLGLVKSQSPYGLGKQEPGEKAFPYRHEWLMACPTCYLGKVLVCKLCDGSMDRGLTTCKCKAAQAAAAAERHEKELERRKTCDRIPLEKYEGALLWADNADKFISPDSVEDHLEEHPDEVFFACKPMQPSAFLPDAEDLLSRMEERAYDEAHPEDHDDDILEFSKESVAELEAAIEAWAEKHVNARTFWYQDMKTIVEVPRGE